MNEKAMSDALDAIHDEATKLLKNDLPQEVAEGLESIISLARYKFDNRSKQESEDK